MSNDVQYFSNFFIFIVSRYLVDTEVIAWQVIIGLSYYILWFVSGGHGWEDGTNTDNSF